VQVEVEMDERGWVDAINDENEDDVIENQRKICLINSGFAQLELLIADRLIVITA
jgi:hypothetical protein